MQHFFDRFCVENTRFVDEEGRSALEFAPNAMGILMDHRWPGNVRELENVVERAVVLATEKQVPIEALPESLLEQNGIHRPRLPIDLQPTGGESLPELVEEFERQVIVSALEERGWNQTETARSLRVALSTFNQKIQRLGIDIKKRRAAG